MDDLVSQRILGGQLDDCPLTLCELAIVRESFTNTLRSMLHTRVDYPKDDDTRTATPRRMAPERSTSRGGRVIARPPNS